MQDWKSSEGTKRRNAVKSRTTATSCRSSISFYRQASRYAFSVAWSRTKSRLGSPGRRRTLGNGSRGSPLVREMQDAPQCRQFSIDRNHSHRLTAGADVRAIRASSMACREHSHGGSHEHSRGRLSTPASDSGG